MFRSLAAALITHEHIETTDARAKELRRVTDRLVTLGKKGTLHARRQAYKFLNNHQLVQKLFDDIAPRFSDRPGGYTRLVKSRIRFVDQAPMTFVRFVDSAMTDEASPKPEKSEAAAPTSVEEQVKAGVEEELQAAAGESETDADVSAEEVAADETVDVEAVSEEVSEETAAVVEEAEVEKKETETEK
jgi:large subunit ribosomal protein L17